LGSNSERNGLSKSLCSFLRVAKTFTLGRQNYFQVKVLPSFVVLGNWTDQGIRNVQDAPERIKTTHTMVEKAGGKMQLFYTLGKYDFVMIMEVPNDDAVMAILLCLGSMGNVRTTTMKAWTETEGAKVLKAPHP
jgi:uncharacterized protein with GYD domain